LRPDAALDAPAPRAVTRLVPPRSALGEVLDAGALVLGQAGVADARREARLLWATLTETTVTRMWLDPRAAVSADVLERFDDLVRRRVAGEPQAYVIGTAAFRTLHLAVTRDTLIPRPETEGLVEHVLRWGAERRAPRAEPLRGPGPRAHDYLPVALDIGTGTGCIALSLAVEGRFQCVVATDISEAALAMAAANREAIAPAVPVEFRRGSLFAPIAPGERFDVIVANPPYITDREYVELDPSVRDWEPRVALVAGADGMHHVRALLAGAGARLVPGGLLAIEVDSRRAERACAAARAGGWPDARIDVDLFGRPRYLLATCTRAEP